MTLLEAANSILGRLAAGFQFVKVERHFQQSGAERDLFALLTVARNARAIKAFLLAFDDIGDNVKSRNTGNQVAAELRVREKNALFVWRQFGSQSHFMQDFLGDRYAAQ